MGAAALGVTRNLTNYEISQHLRAHLEENQRARLAALDLLFPEEISNPSSIAGPSNTRRWDGRWGVIRSGGDWEGGIVPEDREVSELRADDAADSQAGSDDGYESDETMVAEDDCAPAFARPATTASSSRGSSRASSSMAPTPSTSSRARGTSSGASSSQAGPSNLRRMALSHRAQPNAVAGPSTPSPSRKRAREHDADAHDADADTSPRAPVRPRLDFTPAPATRRAHSWPLSPHASVSPVYSSRAPWLEHRRSRARAPSPETPRMSEAGPPSEPSAGPSSASSQKRTRAVARAEEAEAEAKAEEEKDDGEERARTPKRRREDGGARKDKGKGKGKGPRRTL